MDRNLAGAAGPASEPLGAEPETPQPESVEKRVIAIACLGHGLCHIYALLFAGALSHIVASFEASFTTVAGIGTASYMLLGLGALPSGLLAARTNAKLTLKLFFLLSAVAAVLTGLSRSFAVFAAGLCFIGLFGSLYHVSGLTLISHNVRRKGRALGIHGIAGSAGVALAPVIAGLIITLMSWREAYLIMAVPGLAGFLFLTFDRRISTAVPAAESGTASSRSRSDTLPLFILAVLAMGLNGLIYRGFLTIFPTYMARNITLGALSPALAGGIVSTLILSVGMIGQFTGGYFSDRLPPTKLYLAALCLTLPFLWLMGFTSGVPLVLVSILFAVFHFSGQPVENHIISSCTPSRLVSSAFGVKFVLTFGLGSIAAALAGFVTDRAGMSYVFPVLGGILIVPVVLALVISRMDK